MPDYRRARIPGACYFFTVNLRDRHSDLLVREIELLRACVRSVHERHPFHIDAWVVLPEHMHCLWTLPPGDANFAGRWRVIKAMFSRRLLTGSAGISWPGVWQPRYWEHLIRDTQDYQRHFDYIHINPLKHGHVSQVQDWPYSSFHRAVRQGIYPPDWAEATFSATEAFGEA